MTRSSITKLIVCLFAIVLVLTSFGLPVQAKSDAPALESLKVSVWPEYDKPSTLVMYRGRLTEDVSLPATIRMFIPKNVNLSSTSEIKAGQFVYDRAWGSHQVKSTTEADELTYEITTRDFQFEIYMNEVNGGGSRELDFEFLPSTQIGELLVEIQKPTRAKKFKLEPAASQTIIDGEGFETSLYQFRDVKPENKLEFDVSYEKPDDRPSVSGPNDNPKAARSRTLALIIMAVIIVLMIGLWRWRVATTQVPQRRRPMPVKKKNKKKKGQAKAKFCPACGESVRKDAKFCDDCGKKF